MARKRPGTSRAVGSQRADNFKLIRGIGPAIERHLHSASILTFVQLARLSPDEIAALVTGPSAKRIVKENWIGQAHKLTLKRAPVKPRKHATALRGRQHYATFTVELLLDEDNDVRRTRVAHIQSGDEDTWAGWQDARLKSFFVQRAALRLPPAEPLPPVAAAAEQTPPSAAPAGPDGILRLRELEIVPADVGGPCNALRYGQPFDVRLTLDFTDVIAPSEVPLAYTVAIYAKKLGGSRQFTGEAHGFITPDDSVTINVEGTAIPPGIYLLKAVVTLTQPSAKPSLRAGLMALLESGLLQVY